jgi:hypothetical protein
VLTAAGVSSTPTGGGTNARTALAVQQVAVVPAWDIGTEVLRLATGCDVRREQPVVAGVIIRAGILVRPPDASTGVALAPQSQAAPTPTGRTVKTSRSSTLPCESR